MLGQWAALPTAADSTFPLGIPGPAISQGTTCANSSLADSDDDSSANSMIEVHAITPEVSVCEPIDAEEEDNTKDVNVTQETCTSNDVESGRFDNENGLIDANIMNNPSSDLEAELQEEVDDACKETHKRRCRLRFWMVLSFLAVVAFTTSAAFRPEYENVFAMLATLFMLVFVCGCMTIRR